MQFLSFTQLFSSHDEHFTHIASDSIFDRLVGLINPTYGDIVIGGEYGKKTRYISPTVVTNVTKDDSLMQKRIVFSNHASYLYG